MRVFPTLLPYPVLTTVHHTSNLPLTPFHKSKSMGLICSYNKIYSFALFTSAIIECEADTHLSILSMTRFYLYLIYFVM